MTSAVFQVLSTLSVMPHLLAVASWCAGLPRVVCLKLFSVWNRPGTSLFTEQNRSRSNMVQAGVPQWGYSTSNTLETSDVMHVLSFQSLTHIASPGIAFLLKQSCSNSLVPVNQALTFQQIGAKQDSSDDRTCWIPQWSTMCVICTLWPSLSLCHKLGHLV